MATIISTQEIKAILDEAPKGTDKVRLIKDLQSRGYQIQGLDDENQEPQTASTGTTGLRGVAVGAGKGAASTFKGSSALGEKVISGIARAVLPKAAEQALNIRQAGETTAAQKVIPASLTTPVGVAEKTGFGIEQVAELAVPATKVAKATQGANLFGRIAPRALTSGGISAAQSGEVGKEAGAAVAIETALPVAGKVITKTLTPVKNVLGRLFTGVAGGVSGAPTAMIDQIYTNAPKAKQAVKELDNLGAAALAEKNARTILNGVSQVRQSARAAFGEGLEKLSKTDIKPAVFREQTQSILDKFGSVVKDGTRQLKNVEFDDQKNITKASGLIDRLSRVELDGKSLRKLADDIENSAYKVATTDERLSYNVFARQLSDALKNAVSKSTDKLDDINKAFSDDMQLVQVVEDTFGKVKFKNTSEVVKTVKKMDKLFAQNNITAQKVTEFFDRIGKNAEDFKTVEAVRQIGEKATGSNAKGLNITELIQQATSAVVTPETVRNVAILAGTTDNFISTLFNKLGPTARAMFIEAVGEAIGDEQSD